MGIKQEIEVLKRNDGKKAVSVDDIVTGVQQCKIDNNGSKDNDITQMLKKLNLDDCKTKKLQNLREGKSQPKEDDERDACSRSSQPVVSDNLVRLDAPNSDDKEYDEDNVQPKHEDEDTGLGERGPALGVPVNNQMDPGHNYIANKSCKPYQFQTNNLPEDNHHQAILPPNFPDYRFQACRVAQVKGSKREIDDREVYYEPQKWVRPQNAGMVETNNLNAPWNVSISGMGSANGKTVSHVYQKQMSGGTVYASDGIPLPEEHFFNSHFSNTDQLEFQDLFELDKSAMNIQVDTDDFLPTSGPPSPQIKGLMNQQAVGQINQMPSKMSMDLQHQQWYNSQSPLLPVNQLTNSFNNHFQQQQLENYHQQTIRHYQESGHGKRGSLGNDDCSDGYGSDFSPSHEIQSPPAASPCSVMDGSPATFGGSPPRTNWSPPPSNMSNSSVDSGVCSPMADDQNGYTSMKSPRQGHSMSPQNMSPLPPTPQTRMMSSSPPHQYGSPALTTYQTVAQEKQVLPGDGEAYNDPFIDAHLTDLDCALEVASQDLMAEKLRKGFPLNSLKGNIPISNMNHVNNIININKDIYTGKVTLPPQNFSVTVVSPFGINRRDNVFINNVSTNPAVKATTQTSSFTPKSGIIPNLPTTVPATIPVVNKNSIYQPSTNMVGQQNMKISAISGSNTVQAPQPSIQGKIAILPMNPKPKPQHLHSQMLPVIVTTNGVMTSTGMITPVIIMPSNTTPRKLPTLIPKEPVKPKEQTTESNIKQTNVGPSLTNSASCDGQGKKSNVSIPNGKKTAAPSVEKLLNLARRLVAEMSTSDLKYKDEDGDMYLHVGVCKADRFMVQALLERLVRENLKEIIDMQNSEGQTPLYLAVSTNNTEMVVLLVEHGADVNPFAESVSPTGNLEKTAAIHCASTKGEKYLETLKALLKASKINLNQANSLGHTALMCAILAHGKVNTDKILVNSIPIIRTLIHAGADPNLQVQQSGKTALMYALESHDLELIESTFQLVDPQKLPVFLKTQAFDNSSCLKIAERLRVLLDQVGQQRLSNCLGPGNSRGFIGPPL